MRQAAAKTNDLAGDGTTTSVVLAQGLVAEGVKVFCETHMLRSFQYVKSPRIFFLLIDCVSRWLQLVQTLS